MINVPFRAMYTAKQYISELTIYDFARTTLNFLFLHFMVTHPDDWLIKYAAWMCLLSVVPQILICVRAFFIFPECRIDFSFCFSRTRFRQLGNFAFWQTIGLFGGLIKREGVAIVVNKFYGPIANASMTVANSVSSHTEALVASMQGAFTPAITQLYGEGHNDLMVKMSFRACRLGVLSVLVFIIPKFPKL